MENFNLEDYKVTKPIQLSDYKTELDSFWDDDKKEKELDQLRNKLSEWQDIMYAHNRYGVLVGLQGMDTSGKDSLIREVFKEFNPRGVVVHSFKTPNSTELEHDYLWRHYLALPEKGKFAVFNRTHYENLLVTRVHPEYILNENIPGIEKVEDIQPEFWENRFEQINNFEKHISQNGTIVMKFFFYMSKDEQKKRLLKRLEDEDHQWKFSSGDLKERGFWDDYMKHYEEILNKCSKENAPWYIIPADDKDMARYLVAKIMWEELQQYPVNEPVLSEKDKANFAMYKEQLK
ncbi:polyphosphate kinase 2 family protein [Flavobacterium sp. F372]|uniref:Polyphosphate kinase 2 family protein n=1 Tax=Flavobacterium bernardetii TaxID=2813823 RepID=A0ABR7IVB1_9FLAO|nr:PPK2 family polyphosphate kinase [Flavobacterium bernardetii]MBC5833432.1 polyphosphate kinase 2 family protein [Flavobacterium bernardetii]NHF68664.1 polyphosphate kinase 2 family protein [Flavobacterium bernardetii]